MRLVGIFKGEESYPVTGIHNGCPYRIIDMNGKFLLESVSVKKGIGKSSTPVAFFDDDWQGIYYLPKSERQFR